MWIVMMQGVITTSLLISAISDFMELKTVEARILSYATRQDSKHKMFEAGARLIQIAWKEHKKTRAAAEKALAEGKGVSSGYRSHTFAFWAALRNWKRARTRARSSDTTGPLSREVRVIDLHNNLQDVRTELHDLAKSTKMIAHSILNMAANPAAVADNRDKALAIPSDGRYASHLIGIVTGSCAITVPLLSLRLLIHSPDIVQSIVI